MSETVGSGAETASISKTKISTDYAARGRARRIWTSIHRWVGLIAGVYLVIAGLTGSMLAFWQNIDEWLNRDIMLVASPPAGATYRPAGEIIAAARAAMPAEALKPEVPIVMKYPGHESGAVAVAYILGLPDKETLEEVKRTKDFSKIDRSKIEGYTIFVNPYSATVTGRRYQGKNSDPLTQPFIYMLMSLHCALLWEPFGRLAIAAVGLILLVSTIDGIVLWWPRRGKWKTALTFKKAPSTERFVYDLHKTTGVYLGAILLVSIFSGTYMNFKPPWRALVSLLSPVRELPMHLHSESPEGRSPLSLDAAVEIVDRKFPDGKLQTIFLPTGADGVYMIGKRIDNEVNQATTSRQLVIDQYSGSVLASRDPRNFSAGEHFLEWQYPLHSGEAFGNAGRAFMVAFGFVPLILFVTGFIRWRHKKVANASSRN
jgi:uncharacterized iron-regulated membrane protein